MLSRRQIETFAHTVSRGNAGHAEKLYLQDIILSTVSRETVDELVFKGGTALLKLYQLDRFSEDLDFTAREETDFKQLVRSVVRDLENYGAIVSEQDVEENPATFRIRLGVQGPLYTGEQRSLCFLRIEVNKKTGADNFDTLRYNPVFPDIPSFDLAVLQKKEILAEKIRALMTRDQPRDLYDLFHLVKQDVEIDPRLVQKKLQYYRLTYRREDVVKEMEKLRRNWDSLDALVYSSPPPVDEAVDMLAEALPRA